MALLFKPQEVRPYDFHRPHQLSRLQLDGVVLVRESFLRLASTFLSAYLRTPVTMQSMGMEQVVFEEFVREVPTPSVIAVYREPTLELGGSAIVQCDTPLALAMIDRALGGPGNGSFANRELTEIEQTIFNRLLIRLLELHAQSWSKMMELAPHLDTVYYSPAFAQIAGEEELVVEERQRVEIEGQESILRWIWPYAIFHPLAMAAGHGGGREDEAAGVTPKPMEMRRQLERTPVIVKVLLGRTTLTLQEFGQLKPDDVLVLPNRYDRPLAVSVAERDKFQGVAGRSKSRLAVRVVGRLEGGS